MEGIRRRRRFSVHHKPLAARMSNLPECGVAESRSQLLTISGQNFSVFFVYFGFEGEINVGRMAGYCGCERLEE
jgi:hypothetical protein